MNNYNKEKIYEELRNYHVLKLPKKTNFETESLKNRFLDVEDKIVMMLIRFANDKELYVDMATDLEAVNKQVKSFSNSGKDKTMVESLSLKIINLNGIMLFAKSLVLR